MEALSALVALCERIHPSVMSGFSSQRANSADLLFSLFSSCPSCHGQGQIWWSHLGPRVQLICLLFVSWQSDHFWLSYTKFHIWPWKFKVKVMAKVKYNGHIWGLEFIWFVCFLFRGNWTIFGWDIAKSRFDLENSRSRSRQKSTKI